MSKKIKYLKPIIIVLIIFAAYKIVFRLPEYGGYLYNVDIPGYELQDSCITFFNRHPEYIAWKKDRNGILINPNYDSTQTHNYPKYPPKTAIHKYYFRFPVNDSTCVTVIAGFYVSKKKHCTSCNLFIAGYSYNNILKRWKFNDKILTEEQQVVLNIFEEKVLNEMNFPYKKYGVIYLK